MKMILNINCFMIQGQLKHAKFYHLRTKPGVLF